MFTRSGLQVKAGYRGRGRGRGNSGRMSGRDSRYFKDTEEDSNDKESEKGKNNEEERDTKKKTELPIIKETMYEWNDIEALKYIKELTKQIVKVTSTDDEKKKGNYSIMKCNNRIKELMAERYGKENKEDRDHKKKRNAKNTKK